MEHVQFRNKDSVILTALGLFQISIFTVIYGVVNLYPIIDHNASQLLAYYFNNPLLSALEPWYILNHDCHHF